MDMVVDRWTRIVGRRMDIINRKAERSSAEDIEHVIVRDPEVARAKRILRIQPDALLATTS